MSLAVPDFFESKYGYVGFTGTAKTGQTPGEDLDVVEVGFGCLDPTDGGQRCIHGNGAYFSSVAVLGLQANHLYFETNWGFNAIDNVDVIDIFAHEWAHGISQHHMNWSASCEARALNESYSDVLAETSFPSSDGSWKIGELLNGATTQGFSIPRDLQNPEVVGYPRAYAERDSACRGAPESYRRSAPPSRAAQLIADGVGTHSGVGREEVNSLYLSFIRAGLLTAPSGALRSAIGIRDQGDRGRVRCRQDAVSSLSLDPFVATHDFCDLLETAYLETGLTRPTRFGWHQTNAFGGASSVELTSGQVHRGCTISSQSVKMIVSTGEEMTVELTSNSARSFAFAGGEVAFTIDRGADSDPSDRRLACTIHSTLFAAGNVAYCYLLQETFNTPPGVTQQQCRSAPNYHRRVVLSGLSMYPDPVSLSIVTMPTQYFSKWDFFGSQGASTPNDTRAIFGSANGSASGAIVLPTDGRCEVVGVSVRELWFDMHPQHVGALSMNLAVEHDSHSYSVVPLAAATQSLFTRVAWRQNMGARCSYQVAWELQERDDADCVALINSLQGADGSTPTGPIVAGDCTGTECQ